MRYQTTPRFDADFKALKREHRRSFQDVIPAFSEACDGFAEAPSTFRWPASLRVSRLRSAPGVWEMTWSFASPDGRATFEFVNVDGALLVRWRRVGDHSVYASP